MQLDQTQTRQAIANYMSRKAMQDRADAVLDSLIETDFVGALGVAGHMAAKMMEAGYVKQSVKVSNCFCRGYVIDYDDGKRSFMPISACGYSKFCPIHARAEMRRRLERYLAAIERVAKDYPLQFITFTIPKRPVGHLQEQWDLIWDAWGKIRRQKVWKDAVVAAIAAAEVTWTDDGHHLHIHVLAAVKPFWQHKFDWAGVRRSWNRLVGIGDAPNAHVDMREAKNRRGKPIKTAEDRADAARELVKYVSKFGGKGGLLQMPMDAFAEWMDVFLGRRTLRSYGEWYRIGEIEKDETDDDKEIVAVTYWDYKRRLKKLSVSPATAGAIRFIQVYKSTFTPHFSDQLGRFLDRMEAESHQARGDPGEIRHCHEELGMIPRSENDDQGGSVSNATHDYRAATG